MTTTQIDSTRNADNTPRRKRVVIVGGGFAGTAAAGVLRGADTDEQVDEHGVIASGKRIPSATVLWTAGVAASPLIKAVASKVDRAGRALVDGYMGVAEAPNVFIAGDATAMTQDGRPVPGVAQAAIQQGRFVGRMISR